VGSLLLIPGNKVSFGKNEYSLKNRKPKPLYLRRMFLIKPIGLLAAVAVIVACFFPWVIIESRHLIISGMDTTGTSFGKPGVLHITFSVIYIILFIISSVWSRRINLLVAAFNFAWAVRNLMLISTCSGGECPVKQPALYIVFIGSFLMLVAVLSAPGKDSRAE
jgi:hypothetical protein